MIKISLVVSAVSELVNRAADLKALDPKREGLIRLDIKARVDHQNPNRWSNMQWSLT